MEEHQVNQWRGRLHTYDLSSLRNAYDEVLKEDDDKTQVKLLAEISYLISVTELKDGNFEKAYTSAQEAIRLYDSLEIATLEQAAPILFIHLPDKMHADVVRDRVLNHIPAHFQK